MEIAEQTWYVLEDRDRPGEHLTLTAGAVKYVLAWTDEAGAAAFVLGNPVARGLVPLALDTRGLKSTFLEAARRLGATHVLFDYQPGAHQAAAAEISRLEALLTLSVEGKNTGPAPG